jgi:cyclic pyranopterin phosphate synthase
MTQHSAIVYRGHGNIYLNITSRCSSDCDFCLRRFTDEVYGASLQLVDEPSAEQIEHAIELAFLDGPAAEVVFCGLGEPTIRLDVVLQVTEWLRLRRIPSRLDTNGHGELLNPDVDVPAALAAAGLDAVSVSLNAADPEVYDLICRPLFAKAHRAVIRFAAECVRHGITTSLTAVDQPAADLPGCKAIARAAGARFRARALVTAPDAQAVGEKETP